MARKAGMSTGVEVARISVKVSPDTKQFRRDLKSDLDAVERSVTASIDVEPDMGDFRSRVKAAAAGMRATVAVDADVDRRSLKSFKAAFEKTSIFGGGGGPSFGSGLNSQALAIIAAGLAAATPLLSGALGAITTALVSLPGLISAVAVPVGALTLGIDGLTKAAERLKPPFDELKQLMTQRVQEQFTPMFDKLGEIFPTLKASLPGVTQGLADIGKSIADVVASPSGLSKIGTTIDNIARAIRESAPGIGDFTDGLLSLVQGFTGNLPDVAKWINDTGKSFKDWAADFTKKDWFGNSDFDRALGGLGDTLKTIGGGLVDIGGKALDFFSDPEKVKSFAAELEGVVKTLTTLVDLSNKLAENISKVPGFKDGAFQVTDLLPIQMQLGGQLFEALPTLLAGTWERIKADAQAAWQTVSGTVSAAVSVIGSTVSSIGGIAQGTWDGIVAVAQGAWNSVVSAAQSAWGNIMSTVSNAVSSVFSSVTSMASQVVGALANLAQEGIIAGRNLVQGLIDGISGMISSAVAKARELASGVANAFKSFLGIHSPSRLFTEYGKFTAEGFGIGLENGFQPVLDQAKALAQKIADAFSSGADPTSLLAGVSKLDVSRIEKTLGLEIKRLESQAKALDYQAKTTGDKSLKGRADEIRMLKDQVGLQREMLSLTQDYSDEIGSADSGGDPLVKAASGLMAAPVDFAKATGKQFLSDLGVSGDGLISRAIGEGIQYIFQIGSVDEAMSIKDRETSKNALPLIGR